MGSVGGPDFSVVLTFRDRTDIVVKTGDQPISSRVSIKNRVLNLPGPLENSRIKGPFIDRTVTEGFEVSIAFGVR